MSSAPPPVVTVVATDEREDPGAPGDRVDLDRWRALAAGVLEAEGVTGPAELNLVFVDADRMGALNATFMDEVGPTDVLSFPLDPEPTPDGALRLLGDVVVCPAVARQRAGSSEDYDAEVALLVVHGVLHVLGMDHAEPDEAAAMIARERRHLAAIGLERRS